MYPTATTATPLSPTTAILQVSKIAATLKYLSSRENEQPQRDNHHSAQTDDSGIGSTDSSRNFPADDEALICTETIDSAACNDNVRLSKNKSNLVATARQSPPESPPPQPGGEDVPLEPRVLVLHIDDALRTSTALSASNATQNLPASITSALPHHSKTWNLQPEFQSMLNYRLQQEQKFFRSCTTEPPPESLWLKLFTLPIRQKLINWMSEITEVYQCLPCILPIAVNIVDRIMTVDAQAANNGLSSQALKSLESSAGHAEITANNSNNFVGQCAVLYNIEKLQIVGACCVMLATKLLSQSRYLDTSDLRNVLPDYVEWQHVAEVEQAIMRRLSFEFSATVELNTVAFLDLLIETIAKSYNCVASNTQQSNDRQQVAAASNSVQQLGTVNADDEQPLVFPSIDARLAYLFAQYSTVIRQLTVEVVHNQLTNYELCCSNSLPASRTAAACLVRGLAGALQHAYDNAFCTASSANNDTESLFPASMDVNNDNNSGDNNDFLMGDNDNQLITVGDDAVDISTTADSTSSKPDEHDDLAWTFLRDLGYNEAMDNVVSSQLLAGLVRHICALMNCDESEIFEPLVTILDAELCGASPTASVVNTQQNNSNLSSNIKQVCSTSKRSKHVATLITSCMEMTIYDDVDS